MSSICISLVVIFFVNFLVCAQDINVALKFGVVPQEGSTVHINHVVDELDQIKSIDLNDTQYLRKRKEPQATWLDDFGYDENIRDGLIPKPVITFPDPTHITPKSCGECACGLRFRYKIVGGMITKKYEFPWMAVLLYQDEFLCGASLINDRYLVTAAHCVHGYNHNDFVVRFNEFDRYSPHETKSFNVKISKVIEYPEFSESEFNKDVALLKLVKPLKLGASVPRPICLPLPRIDFTGLNAGVAGWGFTKENGTSSNQLLKTVLPIVPQDECVDNYKEEVKITRFMICAGFKEGGKSSCQGDSGGPLMVIQKKKYRVIGVGSFIAGCAKPNFPTVFARITEFLPWIKANTKDACYCK